MKITHLILLLALFSAAAATEGVWYDGDKIAPDRPHQKAKAGLGVQLQLTAQESFFTDWASPQTPRLEIVHTASAGDRVFSVLFFFGAGKDKKGQSYVTFSGRVLDPRGKPIQEFNDVRVIHGPNSAREYDHGLSEGHMMVQFSSTSEKGTYRFEVVVNDHVKEVTLPLEQKIELK